VVVWVCASHDFEGEPNFKDFQLYTTNIKYTHQSLLYKSCSTRPLPYGIMVSKKKVDVPTVT